MHPVFDNEILSVSLQLRELVVNLLAGVEPFGDANVVCLVPIVHQNDDSIVVNVPYLTPDRLVDCSTGLQFVPSVAVDLRFNCLSALCLSNPSL